MMGIDHQTRQFYLDMGYSDSQIQHAYLLSQQSGMDILDALNLPPEATAPPIQQGKPVANNYVNPAASPVPQQPASFTYRNETSFLTMWKKIKQGDYQIFFSKNNKHQQNVGKVELRQENYPVGLLNVSNCCYLNSLLQCYFLMNNFKTAIFAAEPLPNLEEVMVNESKTKVKRIQSQYELLKKLKLFFSTMAFTSKKYLDPTSILQHLVDSVGEKISYGEEKDLSEINILIIQRLSQGLTYSKGHYQSVHQENLLDFQIEKEGSTIIQNQNENNSKKPFNSIFNPRQGAIKQMFYGTRVEYYDDPQLQKQAPIVSDFAGLILNPRGGNLYKSLDEEFNFEVEINGGMQKKTAFIRDQPQYLFIYINRTDFDKEQGQALKNQQKFTFDFSVYLDRYLQKYRQKNNQSHGRIQQLLSTKNKLKQQISNLQILFKKIDDCQQYANDLEGWTDKLPKQQQFQQQYDRLSSKLQKVEQQLNQIESRKEQYHLMYIFVHRGDAVSGHYWGYGRNDEQWYRFDINTRQIMQEQIIIDLQKSSGTPYALLYVKQQNLPKLDYKLHVQNTVLKEKYNKNDFRSNLNPQMVNQIISQNVVIHEKALLRNSHNLRDKTLGQYVSRLNGIKKVGKMYGELKEKNRHVRQVAICNNFSLFLWSKNEIELCKFTLFEQALYNVSNTKYTVQRLMHELPLLHLIQKKFKKSLRGEFYLKFYSLLPKEVEKLEILYQEYQISAFEVIWSSVVMNQAEYMLDQWNNQVAKNKGSVFEPSETVRNRINRVLKLMTIRTQLYRSENFKKVYKQLVQPLYISQMNHQIARLLLLSIVSTGLKIEALQQFINLNDQLGTQLAAINANNNFSFLASQEEKKEPIASAVELVTKFNSMLEEKGRTRQVVNSPVKSKGDEKKLVSSSGFKNSLLTSSPNKIQVQNKKRSSLKEEQALAFGLCTKIASVLILQPKDNWKLEQLQKIKINNDFGAKLLTFLKKLGPVPKVYKAIIQSEKVFSIGELRQKGMVINQAQNSQEKKGEGQVKQQEDSLI